MRFLAFAIAANVLLLCESARSRDVVFKDDVTRRAVALQLNQASTDDFLLTWAKTSEVNVLVDTTDFPQDTQRISEQRQGALGQLLLTFAAERKLGGRRYDDKTFLLWRLRPDLAPDTARLIIARELKLEAAAEPAPNRDDMNALLNDYFQRVHGWDGKTGKVDIKVKVADLPSPLRERTLAATRKHLLSEARESYIWFSDDLWNKARLHLEIAPPPYQGGTLEIGAAVEQELFGQMMPLYVQRTVRSPWSAIKATVGSARPFRVGAQPHPAVVKPLLDLQAPDETQPKNKAIPGRNLIPPIRLKGDPALGAMVSLEAKRLSIAELLSELQKQSQVTYSLAGDIPVTKSRLTLRVEKMPLWNLMGALSRLYGFEWEKKADAAYVMHQSSQNELDVQLLRISQPATFPLFATPQQSQEAKEYLAEAMQEISDNIDPQAASTDAGLPFVALVPPLQQKLRERFNRPLS